MDSFRLSAEQIARVLGGAIADELSRRFDRHPDFLAIAGWNEDTLLGAGGLDLDDQQRGACARRVGEAFAVKPEAFSGEPQATLRDWANVIEAKLAERWTRLSFKSALRDEDGARTEHRADEVFQDAAAAANLLVGRRRLLSFVAPHSYIGFTLTILAANLHRIESLDARAETPDTLTQSLAYGDVLVATPTLWRYLIREGLTAPDNTMAVSFGETLSSELGAGMRKAGFGVLREFYGSTETGLMGWRDGPDEAFSLLDHWRREGDDIQRLTATGDWASRGAMDALEWEAKRAFRVAGRIDGGVQIGAVTVFPDDVASRLGDHKHVAQCEISAEFSEDGVARLVAHIALKDGVRPSASTTRDIDAFCRRVLRQQERPRIFHFYRSL